MSKIIFFLSTAFNVEDVKGINVEHGEKRTNQYIEGIKKFFDFDYSKYNHEIRFVISDNTINDLNSIDKRITEVIPDNVGFDIKDDNKYGSHNKGSGILTSWDRSSDEIIKYDYILHFEPRLLINSHKFIEDFLNNPRTIFTLGTNKAHFNTGLFSFNTKEFIKFINSTSPRQLAQHKISIEYTLYNFVINNKISFYELDKMNVRWFDTAKNTFHDM